MDAGGSSSSSSSSVVSLTATIPISFCGRPVFHLRQRSMHCAGTAFLLRTEKQVLLTTVMHCFGPAGGFSRQLSHSELKNSLIDVAFTNFSGDETFAKANAVAFGRVLPMTTNEQSDDTTGDIVSFSFTAAESERLKAQALPLAESLQLGDSVWLIGREVRDRKKDADGCSQARTFAGVVAKLDSGATIIHLLDKRVDLWCFSGSPVLDAARQRIVGMLGGGDRLPSGQLYINCTPLPLLLDWVNTQQC